MSRKKQNNGALMVLNHTQASSCVQRVVDAAIDSNLPERPACGQSARCSDCCKMAVSSTFAAAWSMVRAADSRSLEIVEARLPGELRECEKPDMDHGKWLDRQVYCVWLHPETHRCMAYGQRPLACRRYVSYEREKCGVPDAKTKVLGTGTVVPEMHLQVLENLRRMDMPPSLAPLPVHTHVALTLLHKGGKAAEAEAKRLHIDTLERGHARWMNLA